MVITTSTWIKPNNKTQKVRDRKLLQVWCEKLKKEEVISGVSSEKSNIPAAIGVPLKHMNFVFVLTLGPQRRQTRQQSSNTGLMIPPWRNLQEADITSRADAGFGRRRQDRCKVSRGFIVCYNNSFMVQIFNKDKKWLSLSSGLCLPSVSVGVCVCVCYEVCESLSGSTNCVEMMLKGVWEITQRSVLQASNQRFLIPPGPGTPHDSQEELGKMLKTLSGCFSCLRRWKLMHGWRFWGNWWRQICKCFTRTEVACDSADLSRDKQIIFL